MKKEKEEEWLLESGLGFQSLCALVAKHNGVCIYFCPLPLQENVASEW